MGVLSWLNPFNTIVSKLADAYAARQNAKTDQERIDADERIATLKAQASAQRPVDSFVRIAFAAPVAIYYGKLFLWDKVLALGATDPLSADLIHVSWVIIGFYFLHSIAKG